VENRIKELKVDNKPGTLAHSRVVWAEGPNEQPRRIVLLQVGEKRYATRVELLAWVGDRFVHDGYTGSRFFWLPATLEDASEDYRDRCKGL
jgi:hypothetical protein